METEDGKEQWKCANLCMTSFCSNMSFLLYIVMVRTLLRELDTGTLVHELDTGTLVLSWTLLRELDPGRLLRDIDTGTELSVVSFVMMMKNKRVVSKANHVLTEASKRNCHKSVTFSFWKDELLPFENNFDVNLVR